MCARACLGKQQKTLKAVKFIHAIAHVCFVNFVNVL